MIFQSLLHFVSLICLLFQKFFMEIHIFDKNFILNCKKKTGKYNQFRNEKHKSVMTN